VIKGRAVKMPSQAAWLSEALSVILSAVARVSKKII
jgi:hypothetical protein